MKRSAGEVDCGAMSETVDDVWMAHAVECDCLVLKIRDERSFELVVRSVLQVKIERFDNNRAWGFPGSEIVFGDVDLGIAAASEAFDDVVSAVESTLLKFEFRHQFALIRTLDA
jgi:hypothetical protein